MLESYLFHPPSLYTMADMVVTLLLLLAMIQLWRRPSTDSVELQRALNHLASRLNGFEISHARTAEEEQSFHRALIEANGALLEERRKMNNLMDKVVRRVDHLSATLEARPCVANEVENGDEPCPDGQEIGKKR